MTDAYFVHSFNLTKSMISAEKTLENYVQLELACREEENFIQEFLI